MNDERTDDGYDDDDEPLADCLVMFTRSCIGNCDLTGYCFRFPWYDVLPFPDEGGGYYVRRA